MNAVAHEVRGSGPVVPGVAPDGPGTRPRRLGPLPLRAPWLRLVVAWAPAAALGLALGVVMPRGPMTTGQSVSALGLAAVVGAFAGWWGGRRAAVVAPVVYAVVFELVRLDVTGPTVDGIRLDSLYAVGALVAGRGFDALVVLLPMAVAALWAAVARRRRAGQVLGGRRAVRVLRRAGLGVGSGVVVLVLALLVRPASTEPILDADGSALEGSIAELVTVPIGGHEQGLMLRGHDVDAPVLLFLEGGPGGTAVGAMRYGGEGLEEDFVVATWDQRGTGRSAGALEPAGTLTVAQSVADTIEVVEYLCDRFDESGVYVVGSSWGTTLGVLAVQARPDLFHAYVGTGQMVSQAETDQLMYAESLDDAVSTGADGFADQLRRLGPPPYDDVLSYPIALSSNPRWTDFTPGADNDWRSAYPVSLFVAEYTFTEQIRSVAALMETFGVLYPQLQGIDFRRDVPTLGVPTFVVLGEHEASGRAVLAQEWFVGLDAPAKELVVWDHSGHTPHLDEPGRFAAFMEHVLEAAPAR